MQDRLNKRRARECKKDTGFQPPCGLKQMPAAITITGTTRHQQRNPTPVSSSLMKRSFLPPSLSTLCFYILVPPLTVNTMPFTAAVDASLASSSSLTSSPHLCRRCPVTPVGSLCFLPSSNRRLSDSYSPQ